MIICDDFQQGTPEWLQAKLGVVSASHAADIVTSTGKKAAGQSAYLYRLAAEIITQEPIDGYQSLAMLKGIALEPEGRAAYSLETGNKVRQVGFVYVNVTKRLGFSPDGLVGDVGGVEIKSVMAHTQAEYIDVGKVPTKYKPQVFSSLYFSGLEWWDFFTHSPGMPPFLVRINSYDDEYQSYAAALAKEIPGFLARLDELVAKIRGQF